MVAIKRLRERRNKTQLEMSEALSVDRSTVAKWEADGTYPRPAFFKQISEFLGCSIDELFREEQARTG